MNAVATDLVRRLREMAQFKHDDLSIGDEAASEIERLWKIVEQVDDFLIDWHLAAVDDDYTTALHHYVKMSKDAYDDPSVSAVARERKGKIERLEKANATQEKRIEELICEKEKVEKERDHYNAYCGSQKYMSDFQNADQMRAALDEVQKERDDLKARVAQLVSALASEGKIAIVTEEYAGIAKERDGLAKRVERLETEIYRVKENADGYQLERDGAKATRDEYRKVLEFYAHDMLYFPRTIVLECQQRKIPLAPIYAEFGDAARLALGMPTTKTKEMIEAMKDDVAASQKFKTRMEDKQ